MPQRKKRNRWFTVHWLSHPQSEQNVAGKYSSIGDWQLNDLRYSLQSWVIGSLIMWKISEKVIKFTTKNMKNWKVELTVGRKSIARVENHERYIPRICFFTISICCSDDFTQSQTWKGYKLTKSKENEPFNLHERYKTVCLKWKRERY